jgi:glycine cleavage system H protein
MEIREPFFYTKEHEWVSVDGDIAIVGITDYAQGELGDIVFVELPEIETETTAMQPFGVIEAVKTVSDLYAPVSGKIIEVNDSLVNTPDLINKDPYGEGWIIKIQMNNKEELNKLLNASKYKELVGN